MIRTYSKLNLSVIFSFCLSMNDINLEKGGIIFSISLISVLVEVCSPNAIDSSSNPSRHYTNFTV